MKMMLIDEFYFMFFSALDKIILQGYKALQLQYFFTAGPDEVKCWTIQVLTQLSNDYLTLLMTFLAWFSF